MAYGVVLTFEGVDENQYWAVNENLGIDEEGTIGWPEGLLAHSGALSETGLVIWEMWESKDDQRRYQAERLDGALAAAGVSGPDQVIELDVFNFQHPG